MPVALLALLDRLDDVQAQRHAGLLDPVDLGRDERLGDPREPHQDVGDGPVHTLVTTPAARDHALEESFTFARPDQCAGRRLLPRRRRRLGGRAAARADLALRRARAPAGPRGDPRGAVTRRSRAAAPRRTPACTSTATRTPTTSSRGASASSGRRVPARRSATTSPRARRGWPQLLGERVDPFFTPPWNRCTRDTGEVLVELGFTLLSREHRAEPLGLLPELPVHLDVARLAPDELDSRFAERVRAGRAGRRDVPPRRDGVRRHASGRASCSRCWPGTSASVRARCASWANDCGPRRRPRGCAGGRRGCARGRGRS